MRARRQIAAAAKWVGPSQLGVAAFALLEAAWFSSPQAVGAVSFARGVLLALALAAPAGLILGVILWAIRVPERITKPPLGVVVGVPIGIAAWSAAFGGSVLFAAYRLNDPGLSAWAVAIAAVAALPVVLVPPLILRRLCAPLDRRFPNAGPRAVIVALAVGFFVFPWSSALSFASVALAAGISTRSVTGRIPAKVSAGMAVAGIVVALSPLCDDEIVFEAQRGAVLLPHAAAVISPIFDLDRDGALPVLGSGDCDEANSNVGPHGIEVRGDSIDQDCRFGDLPAAPSERGEHPRARRVVLVTVSGLGIDRAGTLGPRLEKTQQQVDGGIRFANSIGIRGRFRDVAPVLTDGRLPPVPRGLHSAFDTGVDSIPSLLERGGGNAYLAVRKKLFTKLSTQFHRSRTKATKTTDEAISAASRVLPGADLLWLHVEMPAHSKRAKFDKALAKLLAKVRGSRGAVAIIVGLGAGPLAIVSSDHPARLETRPVGLYDIYPTLTGLLDLHPPDPVAGDSLLALPERPGVLTAKIEPTRVLFGAKRADAEAFYIPHRRRFATRGDAGGLVELVRARVLGPRLLRANLARRSTHTSGFPDDMDGELTVVARALTAYGCTSRQLGPNRVVVNLYLRGGEALRPNDMLKFRLSSAFRGSTRGRRVPGGGTLPFGSWTPGKLIVERFDLDVRRVLKGTASFWIGVERDGKALPITTGSGSMPKWGRVCSVEVE